MGSSLKQWQLLNRKSHVMRPTSFILLWMGIVRWHAAGGREGCAVSSALFQGYQPRVVSGHCSCWQRFRELQKKQIRCEVTDSLWKQGQNLLTQPAEGQSVPASGAVELLLCPAGIDLLCTSLQESGGTLCSQGVKGKGKLLFPCGSFFFL